MRSLHAVILCVAVLPVVAFGVPTTITFEELGLRPINFSDTIPLRDEYPGVSFSGPGPADGGAIVNVNGAFGIAPLSGDHFLAFNRTPGFAAMMLNGGLPQDPERITFTAELMRIVSIHGGSGFGFGTSYLLEAFGDNGVLLGTVQAAAGPSSYATLGFTSQVGIRSIRLTETSGANYFVYDNLTYLPIPAPGGVAALATGLLVGLARRSRR